MLLELQSSQQNFAGDARISRLSSSLPPARPPARPSSSGLLQSSCGIPGNRLSARSLPGSCPLALPQDATETCKGDPSPRGPKLARGGWGGRRPEPSASPGVGTQHPALSAPGPLPRARPPACQSHRRPPPPPPTRASNTARRVHGSRLEPGRAAAACPLPGAGNGGGRLPGASSDLTPSPLDPANPSSSG